MFLTQTKISQKRDSVWQPMLFKYITHLKPEGGGGGVRATHGNLTVTYIPRVGILIGHHAFDLLIQIVEEK